MLLTTAPPFAGEEDDEIRDNIKKGSPQYDSNEWNSISDDAKDLIKNVLLEYDYKSR